MLKKVKCNLCGADHYVVLYKRAVVSKSPQYLITEENIAIHEQIVRCLKCGLIYANPRRTAREIISNYRQMTDERYLAEEKGRRISASATLGMLARLAPKKGRLLDIGCAAGFLLDEAKKDTWEAYGLELSGWAASHAQEKFGLNVTTVPLHKANFARNFFDCVVMKDVIEHLTNPKDVLISIRDILKPEGILCITTPNITSLPSKILRAKWWGINQFHLYYFSRASLKEMLSAAGFDIIKCRSSTRTFSLNYWVERFREYNEPIYRLLKFLTRFRFLRDRLIKIDLADQIEVFARRSRRLAFLEEPPEPKYKVPKRKKTVVVLPAYNAAKTLRRTVKDIPRDIVDNIILVDDASHDGTVKIAKELGLKVFVHSKNRGYGGNQKTCYEKALEEGAEIVVMVHPDYQYDPRAIPDLIAPIQRGDADAVFGSRMMKGGALEGGMPLWKHNANILLTAFENIILGTYLTEYHSGFRAYSSKLLKKIRFNDNSDGFVFDTEIIVQASVHYFRIEEVPIRTRYFDEASTIKLLPSIIYGLGIVKTMLKYILHKHKIVRFAQFK